MSESMVTTAKPAPAMIREISREQQSQPAFPR